MAEYPALPLWTDAYLADTRHLSDAEHGRYLLLLMDMWRAPGCRFPNDRTWLERKFRRSPEAFSTEIQPLLEEFCQCDGNWWTQKKLMKVWREVQEVCARQSARAKLRWEKEKASCHGNAALGNATKTKTLESKTPPSATKTASSTQTPPLGANGHHKPKSDDRGTRMPADWRPSDEAVRFCLENVEGCTKEILNQQFPILKDWALTTTGPKSRKRDWDRYLINWIRRVCNEIREREARERRWAEQRGRTAH